MVGNYFIGRENGDDGNAEWAKKIKNSQMNRYYYANPNENKNFKYESEIFKKSGFYNQSSEFRF